MLGCCHPVTHLLTRQGGLSRYRIAPTTPIPVTYGSGIVAGVAEVEANAAFSVVEDCG